MRELKNKDEQYKEYLKYKKPKKQNNEDSFSKLLFTAVIGIICAFVFYSTVILNPRVNTNQEHKIPFWQNLTKKEKKGFNIPFFNKKQNLLVLGVDSNGQNTDKFKGTRSDTILLMNIDPSAHSINVISIPRDSKVYLADNNGVQKINHAHAIGGINLTKKTIEKTLGVKIDRYVIINTEGVRELVDIIGGIPIYVEKPLNYDDYAGKLHIHLKQGNQVLNGVQAEGFLRYRHDGLGDIGRTSRQQWFFKSLLEALKSPAILPKIPEALKVSSEYIRTDMSLYELSHLAALARDIDLDSVEVSTLPGSPSSKSQISYWILDPDKTQDVVDRLIYRKNTADTTEKLSAGIVYTSHKEEMAMNIKDKLQELGYNVNCVDRAKAPHSQIVAHNKNINSDTISKIKRKTPPIKRMQFLYDPNNSYCSQSDFTIILSE